MASSASARTNGSGAAAGGDGGGGSTSRLFSSGFSIPGRGPRGVRLGWGLHAGWAIEGAIGSDHKIDASYLSPHVNISARLEGATKQVSQRVDRGTNVGRSLLLVNKSGAVKRARTSALAYVTEHVITHVIAHVIANVIARAHTSPCHLLFTPQYRVPILMSGEFVSLLSPAHQDACMLVDVVRVLGSRVPLQVCRRVGVVAMSKAGGGSRLALSCC